MQLPEAELHLHIEGTPEPAVMFATARRNRVELLYADEAAVRRAYVVETWTPSTHTPPLPAGRE